MSARGPRTRRTAAGAPTGQGGTSRGRPWWPGKSKYRAVPTTVDGFRFASKAESRRYQELLLLGLAGEIRNLELQPRFILTVNGSVVGRFTPDFRYDEVCRGPRHCGLDICPGGHRIDVVEEMKGFRVRDYILRQQLFCALHPTITFRETR